MNDPKPPPLVDSADWASLQESFLDLLETPAESRTSRLEALNLSASLKGELEAMLKAHHRGDSLRLGLDYSPISPPSNLPPRSMLGRYRLRSSIGEGGMGEVWLAERSDLEFAPPVALKRIKGGLASKELRHRFAIETQALGRLSHRNIALFLDADIDEDGFPFLVIEYVDGPTITAFADQKQLTIEERLRYFLSICEAVAYAHANLVVHRDLKPSNILINEAEEVRLLDFGIAKILKSDESDSSVQTRTLHRLLTPEYASPEQVEGGPITVATDVHALGLLLFELLTGRRAFEKAGTSLLEIQQAVCIENPPRPSSVILDDENPARTQERARARSLSSKALKKRLRGDLDAIVNHALQKDPKDRYGSVDRLAEDVERHLQGKSLRARPDGALHRLGKFLRRHRAMTTAVSLIFVLASMLLISSLRQSRLLARERDQARLERDTANEVSSFVIDLFSADPFADSEGFRDDSTLGDFLAASENSLRQELTDRPDLQARLFTRLARFHGNLGNLEHALNLAEESLNLNRGLPSDSRLAVADSLNVLATILQDQGQWDAAVKAFREGLTLRQAIHNPPHLELAESANNLAVCLMIFTPPTEEVEDLIRDALDQRTELLGLEHEDTLQSLNTMGTFLFRRGRPEDIREAEGVFRNVVTSRSDLLGPRHPLVANAQNNLANLLDDMDREEEAILLFREAIETYRQSLGVEHSSVANSLFGMAEAYEDLGNLQGAEEALRSSLAIDERNLPPNHLFLASTRLRLGEVLLARGRASDAEPYFRRAVNSLNQESPSNNETDLRIRALVGLAECLLEGGQGEEAILHAQAAASRLSPLTAPKAHLAQRIEAILGDSSPPFPRDSRNPQTP